MAPPQPLNRRHSFLRPQKPRLRRRVRERETRGPETDRQHAREQIDILPAPQITALDLREAVVERAAEDCEEPRGAEPPALPQRLLGLRVVARDDAHEARGDDALDETEAETLRVQPLVRSHGGRAHAYATPDDHDGAEDAAQVEALQEERHGVEPR